MNITSGRLQKAQKVVLYGPEGVGKSSFASQFPNPIFIDTEGSTAQLDVNRLDRPSSWQMLLQQTNYIKNNPQNFQTLVVDTIDWAEMLCTQFVCSHHGKTGIEAFGYGQGYIYVAEEFGKYLNLLTDVIEAGVNVVLNAHSQIVKFEQPDEMGAYDRYQLKLGKKTSSHTAPLVKEWADMVLFMNYKTISVATDDKGKKHKAQGGRRVIHATHHPAWDAKNRHQLPDEFPLDYAQIAHIFNAVPQVAPTQAPPVQPVAPIAPVVQTPPVTPAPPIQTPVDPVQAPVQPATEPPQQPVQAETTAASQEQPVTAADLDSAIPKALQDFMIQDNVKEYEIQTVVSQKGYYPYDTPIINYDPTFIEGVLVGAWPQVHQMVIDFRATLPF